MSDYIYNNFSSTPDKDTNEPVNIYFETERNRPKRIKKKTVALICSLCILLSGISGVLGASIINDLSPNGNTNSPQVITNTIFRALGNDSNSSTAFRAEDSDDTLNISQVVALVENSVVEISTQYVVTSSYQYITSGAGSGVIIGTYDNNPDDSYEHDGYYIITNAHVIQDDKDKTATTIEITLKDGTTYPATVKGCDTSGDIAVLMIEEREKEFTCATFGDSDKLVVGQDVIAIGNPLGRLGGSVTNGIISALDREINVDGNVMNLLQSNAAINPGNSGGGLFNMKGELIGIVNAKSSGTGIEGLGFAIPSKDAFKLCNDIINYGYVKGKPFLYITVGNVITKNSLLPRIISLVEGYNDDVLEVGDIICSVNGTPVTKASEVENYIKKSNIGDTLDFVIIRDGKTMNVLVTVYEYQP